MLDRLASRALFWGAIAILSGAGGLLSVGALPQFWQSPLSEWASPLHSTTGWLPTFGEAAPFLSLAAFAVAMAGWRLLHREVTRQAGVDQTTQDRVRQLHEAMQASTDGMLLLRTIRSLTGEIADFEITDVNPSGTAMLRTTASSLVGRRLRRDFHASMTDAVFSRYLDAVAMRLPIMEELRVSRRLFGAGWLYHQAVPTAEGIAVTLRDVSSRKREERSLRRASLTDDLTSLYNRRGFLMLSEQQLRVARRQEKDAVLLYVDMDDFKALNDKFGHAEGDRALAAVGRLLRRAVRDSDVVARMGGDEFTIMALDADRAAARLIQRRIEERIMLLNATGELAAPLSLTIGHTRVRPTDPASLTELLARADALLYARKKRRKLTNLVNAQAHSHSRTRRPYNRQTSGGPTLIVPPEVAAIARAAAMAAAMAASARLPTTPNGSPFQRTHVA